jgi:hypothetical protein
MGICRVCLEESRPAPVMLGFGPISKNQTGWGTLVVVELSPTAGFLREDLSHPPL